MWKDIKKIGSLAIDQTKGQKEILLTNLKIKSYADKRDTAFTSLGELLYPLIKDNLDENEKLSNENIRETVKEIYDIESDIKKTREELLSLKSASAGEINKISSEVGVVWKKTKSAITGRDIEKNDSSAEDRLAEDERTN